MRIGPIMMASTIGSNTGWWLIMRIQIESIMKLQMESWSNQSVLLQMYYKRWIVLDPKWYIITWIPWITKSLAWVRDEHASIWIGTKRWFIVLVSKVIHRYWHTWISWTVQSVPLWSTSLYILIIMIDQHTLFVIDSTYTNMIHNITLIHTFTITIDPIHTGHLSRLVIIPWLISMIGPNLCHSL